MASFKKFEDMNVWKRARGLSDLIFKLSLNEPFNKDYGLKNQILNASGSIMDNIAEGFGRGGRKEFINFVSIAKGSASEVQSQLYRLLDRKYIDQGSFNDLYLKTEEIGKMLSGLIKYLKKTDYTGFKFHEDQEIYNISTPKTQNSKPKTQNSKPKTQNSKPKTQN